VELEPERVKSSLNADQYKLYKLIWQRFIASLMATCIQNTVKAEIKAAVDENSGEYCTFSASGYSVKFDGFTVLYDNDAEDEEGSAMLPFSCML